MNVAQEASDADDDLPEIELRPEPVRRRPSTIGGVVYLAVLIAVIVGVAIVASGPFRAGLATMGVAMTGAALARLVLPRSEAGMLGLRPKAIDVVLLGTLGLGLIALSVAIPSTSA